MSTVLSKDGTLIAFNRAGEGPALIMVTGALATRQAVARSNQTSREANLEKYFTVFAYDRRGRGESGDTLPYAVEREVEDLDALITESGGSAFVFGHSSGAVLALEAARRLTKKITKLAVYEPPFIIDDSRPPVPADYRNHMEALVSEGRRGAAVAYFMTAVVGIPEGVVAQMQHSPMWPESEAIAHTLVYDGTIMGDTMFGKPLDRSKWASITMPVLVMDGGNSPAYMHHGVEALANILPHAQHRRFPGQEHGVANEVLVPALAEFFKG
ncbi:MAG: alpha/beta hydrolase [Chloroflexi bacterium]|nr:alpha/beta hydrolase [Chloroflexota bacterium]